MGFSSSGCVCVCQVGGRTHPSSLPIARDSTNPVDRCPCVTYSQASDTFKGISVSGGR